MLSKIAASGGGDKPQLPDVPFVLNYNAKNYDASTHTIPYTEGALNTLTDEQVQQVIDYNEKL